MQLLLGRLTLVLFDQEHSDIQLDLIFGLDTL
jgi:hypothetical protein